MKKTKIAFIRYPGGKKRMLNQILQHLPTLKTIKGRFVEPFVGSGAVFFALNPENAILADINPELIDLYRGIRRYPREVWRIFASFPPTKKAYYNIRDTDNKGLGLERRAARTLYLNRTCFKGMWRQNSDGHFNVGYGGQDRRWVIQKDDLAAVSCRLKYASLKASDFEEIIDACKKGDFIFVDPPYRPGGVEMLHDHYVHSRFSYNDHKRLAQALRRASVRGVKWALTTSSNPRILKLFRLNRIIRLPRGTGKKPGILTPRSGEVLICNYKEDPK